MRVVVRNWRGKAVAAHFSPILTGLEQELNISPRETLYVGNDMLNDIWTARECGCRTALFAGDSLSLRLREDRPECASLSPDVIITHLDQLLDVI